MLAEGTGNIPALRGDPWEGPHCAKLSLWTHDASARCQRRPFITGAGAPGADRNKPSVHSFNPFRSNADPMAGCSGTGANPGQIVLVVGLLFLLLPFPGSSQSRGQQPESEPPESSAAFDPLSIPLGDEVITVRADRQARRGEHDYLAQGNVEISYRDLLLKADEVCGNDRSRDIEGEGNVYFKQGLTQFQASRFKFNLDSQTGTFYDVRGKTDVELRGRFDTGFLFRAKEVRKVGADEYRIVDGTVTACEDPVPKWSFSAKKADFKVDQPVNLRHAVFRIKKLPLFYSPFLRAPTSQKQRKTGFLLPSTGTSSSRGRSVSGAFFLALGRSADLLTRADYYSKRGPGGGLDFKARPNQHSSISAVGYFALDRMGFGGQTAQVKAETRWDNGFRAAADVDVVSSQEFRQVYGHSFNTISRPDEVSSGFLTRNFSSDSLNVFGERRATIFSRERGVTSRTFPSFNLNGHRRRIKGWPIYFSYDTSVEGMSRTDARLSTPSVVQRFDFHPRLSIPLIRWSGISLTPTVGWRETFYSNRLDSQSPTGVGPRNLTRSAFDLELDWRGPGLQRIFQVGRHRLKHLIEPSITYRYISGIDEFRETILFDEKDVFSNSNEVEYVLNNRFFARRPTSDGGWTTGEVLSLSVGQKVFFDPTFGGALVPGRRNVLFPANTLSAFAYLDGTRKVSPVTSRLRFTPARRYTVDFRTDYDPEVQRLRASSVAGRVNLSRYFLGLTYYNTRNLPPNQFPSNQVRARLGRSSPQGISAALSFVYNFTTRARRYTAGQLAYNWDCCGVAVHLRYVGLRQFNPRLDNESQVRFSFFLKNIGSFGTIRSREQLF